MAGATTVSDTKGPAVQVRFYFDPLCPWCWITSFWMDEVCAHRDVQVDWRSISLKVRNEAHELDADYEQKIAEPVERSFRLLRVVEALRAGGHDDVVRDVYVEFGRHVHHADDGMDFDVAAALEAAGADPSFATAHDDDKWDDAVRESTREAEDVAGQDVGTPIVAFEVDGQWKGFFGPVLPVVPRGAEALQLWDGLRAMVEVDGFYELKRTRTIGPDLESVRL